MEKFFGIQYLRAFAAVYVMLYHIGSLHDVHFADTGGRTVRLFFVISGFIIAWTTRPSNESRLAQLKKYSIRRAVRIYPPYWIIFAITAAMFLAGMGQGAWWHRDPANIVQNLFLTQVPHQNIVYVAWSLVYEMFFYCLFGLGVILLRIPVVALCVVWAAAIVAVRLLLPDALPEFLITSKFNLYFIGGCLLAEFHARHPILWRWPAFAALLVFYTILPHLTGSEIPGLIVSVLLVASSLGAFTGKPNKFFLLLGEASYSIYLVHGLVSVILLRIGKGHTPYLVNVFGTLAICLAYYYAVEAPLLKAFRDKKKPLITSAEIKVAPVP